MAKQKKYTFTKEELAALAAHDANKSLARAAEEAADYVMRAYIKAKVAPRLGIDLNANRLSFNISDNTIEVIPKEDGNAGAPAPEASEGETPAGDR